MSFINTWIRPEIASLAAYSIPPSNNCIKLDAMENPYSLSDVLIQQYADYLANAPINRYPDPQASQLKHSLKTHINIAPEYDILLGNGSDELIQLLCLACSPNEVIMSVAPSFVMYKMVATFTHLNHIELPLNSDFELDINTSLTLIQQHQPKLIFIAYPNNPTGNLFNRQDLITLLENTTALVVLDEAYYAYAQDSFLSALDNFDNLVVMRTVSKVGLAGLRLGLLVGKKATIAQFDKIRLPYNINTLTQLSAQFLLDNFTELATQTQSILAQRDIMMVALASFSLIKTYSSQANFILFKTNNAADLFAYLLDNNILIKNLSTQANLKNCLRVTIGTKQENQIFINTLSNYYAKIVK